MITYPFVLCKYGEFFAADNLPYEKVGKNEPVCIADEIQFDIPDSWQLVRLREVCQLLDGLKKTNDIHTVLDAKFLRGKTKGIESNSGRFVTANDLLILVDGENSGEVFITPKDGYMGSTFKQLWISSKLCVEYVLMFIELYRLPLKNSKIGAAIPHLNKQLFFNLIFPIPPYAEQIKIVEKYKILHGFVLQYDSSEKELYSLNNTFRELLKKSILQEAVQGKLVPQDPNDEPASVLLERIRAEKEQLIKEGKIKKDKHESVIFRRDNSHYEKLDGIERCIDEEIPFEIPTNWYWSRLGSIFNVTKLAGFEYTKFFTKENVTSNNDIPIVRARNVRVDEFVDNTNEFIPEELSNLLHRSALTKSCLLMTFIGAGIGDVCIYDCSNRHHLAPNVAKIEPYNNEILLRFVLYWLLSPAGQSNIEAIKKSVAQPSLSMDTIRSILIAFPPKEEQKKLITLLDTIFTQSSKL